MTQAIELAKIIEQLAVAQGDKIYLLCEDGSQVCLKIIPSSADTQWTETVQVETFNPMGEAQ